MKSVKNEKGKAMDWHGYNTQNAPEIVRIQSERLNNMMRIRNISQNKLYKESGIERASIYGILNCGTNGKVRKKGMNTETAKKLADVLGCQYSYLLGDSSFRTKEEEEKDIKDRAKKEREYERSEEFKEWIEKGFMFAGLEWDKSKDPVKCKIDGMCVDLDYDVVWALESQLMNWVAGMRETLEYYKIAYCGSRYGSRSEEDNI